MKHDAETVTELEPKTFEIPPTCPKCGETWEKIEEESGQYHEVYEPVCNCYKRDIALNIG